jgi:hypothetical protein
MVSKIQLLLDEVKRLRADMECKDARITELEAELENPKPVELPPEGWLTLKQSAHLISRSYGRVQYWAEQGFVESIKVGGFVYVDPDNLLQYAKMVEARKHK